ncbi:glycosyltransferase family protein [Marinoscillum pacificum]|uniref:glycosyltransferase family protein n=1 Tax=Marinoscillum pacificum TaxID=392723 RepID=UPI002157596C|nr:glycosyltransferase family protein [Marinoscillum pacificum]
MKYLFLIQGEGRGHMTQALALAKILRSQNHEITRVIVGKSKRRNIPQFFIDKIGCELEHLDSPNFVTDKNQKSVKPFRTIVYSLLKSQKYIKSINRIDEIVKEDQPDVIINFYDFLGGLYNFSRRPKAKFVCIAHQFLIAHPEFEFPPKRQLDKISLQMGNRIASLGADKILALSFQHFDYDHRKKLVVVPPLLREEVKSKTPTSGDHYLVYMVNPGYATEVDQFHQNNPEQSLHCFWDKSDKPETYQVDDSLTYHQLNDEKFIDKMANCQGYVTTAGFESVCEAMYLGKPVLMVPVAGHYEQACNAVDAKKAGAGIFSDRFDIGLLKEYIPRHENIQSKFQNWADQSGDIFLKELT